MRNIVRANPIVRRFGRVSSSFSLGRCHLKGTIMRTRGSVWATAVAVLVVSAGSAATLARGAGHRKRQGTGQHLGQRS
jgi:hypothetical protein